jgi:hypothetical protein
VPAVSGLLWVLLIGVPAHMGVRLGTLALLRWVAVLAEQQRDLRRRGEAGQ